MTHITSQQAKTLIDGATSGAWEAYTVPDDRTTAGYVAVSLADREMVVPPRNGGTGTALDAHLIAAAPDLARTVIAQAEEIEKLLRRLDRTDAELHEYRNEFGDL